MDIDDYRLKVILVENKKTNKWLAEKLEKDTATISKWCMISAQPSVEALMQIPKNLNLETDDLSIPVPQIKVLLPRF